jgi:hypothetical protein
MDKECHERLGKNYQARQNLERQIMETHRDEDSKLEIIIGKYGHRACITHRDAPKEL